MFLFTSCISESNADTEFTIPSTSHDLSYIAFDAQYDDPEFRICDSTDMGSGRNGLTYIGGRRQLELDIQEAFSVSKSDASFNGYIVVRFLTNCKGEHGRFRGQALNLDFSEAQVSDGLVEHTVSVIKDLGEWQRYDTIYEYSKYVNLKFKNGEIEHVLL